MAGKKTEDIFALQPMKWNQEAKALTNDSLEHNPPLSSVDKYLICVLCFALYCTQWEN